MLSLPARADTFVADFSTPNQWDHASSSNGLWNTVDKRIQATFSAANVEIDFGDGSDGDFSDGPAQSGITVSGAAITINTGVKAIYNFRSFNLSAGKTLRGTGPTPLVIHVLGAATIVGTIDVSGAAGGPNSVSNPAAGGLGGAGGGSGGTSGYGTANPGTPGTVGGSQLGTIALGGGPGTKATLTGTENAGGGGCNSNNGGAAAGGVGGAAGACTSSKAAIASGFDTLFLGGAGGGGGGAYLDPGITHTVAGSGGGGAGGAFHFSALGAITFSGTISAKGGDGGQNNLNPDGLGNDCGGGGGGGSGGSVWLQSPVTIGAGTISVAGGAGGTNTACVGSYTGGAGGAGAIRVDSSAGAGYPTGDAKNAPAIRTGQTYTAVSRPIKIYGYTTLRTPIETLDTTSTGCGGTAADVSIFYEGSNDGVNFEHAVPKARFTELTDYPYLRFKAAITTNTATPACVAGLSIPYGPRELSDLKIKGGLFCGSLATTRKGHKPDSNPLEALGDLFLIALAAASSLGFRPRRRLTQ